MSVDLGRRDALMPEHLLHHTQVSPVLDKMSRERMPESMRGYLLGYAGGHCLLLHKVENRHTAHGAPKTAQKKYIITFRITRKRPHLKI